MLTVAGSRAVPLHALRLVGSEPVRLVLVAGLVAAAAFMFDDARLVQFSVWLIYGMLTMSLAFVWGQAGILVFGQNAFFGVGSYLYGILAINLLGVTHETLSALLVAIIGAAVFPRWCTDRGGTCQTATRTLACGIRRC